MDLPVISPKLSMVIYTGTNCTLSKEEYSDIVKTDGYWILEDIHNQKLGIIIAPLECEYVGLRQ